MISSYFSLAGYNKGNFSGNLSHFGGNALYFYTKNRSVLIIQIEFGLTIIEHSMKFFVPLEEGFSIIRFFNVFNDCTLYKLGSDP